MTGRPRTLRRAVRVTGAALACALSAAAASAHGDAAKSAGASAHGDAAKAAASAHGDAAAEAERAPLAAARVDEQLGATLPRGLAFRDASGRAVRLGDYLRGGPVLLVPGYYHCSMLCGRVLEGLADGLRALERSEPPASRFRVLAFSIDPRDSPKSARERQRRVLSRLGWEPERWPFLVGDERAARALAEAVGFRYAFDPRSGEYAHPAVAVAVTPSGAVSSYLYGISFDPPALRAALDAAHAERTRSTLERVLLRCFHYVPALRRYAGEIALFLRTGGLLVAAAVGLWLVRLARHDLRRSAS